MHYAHGTKHWTGMISRECFSRLRGHFGKRAWPERGHGFGSVEALGRNLHRMPDGSLINGIILDEPSKPSVESLVLFYAAQGPQRFPHELV